ncbi:MAG: two-component system response regulator RssB [Pseudomonadota bacterium]|jgi:CheY-like chemotaxis protein
MGKLVFVVEDDAVFRGYLVGQLHQLGLDTREYPNGKGVVTAVLNQKPAACFIDLVMPGVEGIETIMSIRDSKADPKPIVIAISGHGQYLLGVEGLGATEAIRKLDLNPERLRETLTRYGLVP